MTCLLELIAQMPPKPMLMWRGLTPGPSGDGRYLGGPASARIAPERGPPPVRECSTQSRSGRLPSADGGGGAKGGG